MSPSPVALCATVMRITDDEPIVELLQDPIPLAGCRSLISPCRVARSPPSPSCLVCRPSRSPSFLGARVQPYVPWPGPKAMLLASLRPNLVLP